MENNVTFLAKTSFRRKDQLFGIKREDRRQHMYVVGKTGVGKTAFLKNMALQDIEKGEGLAIVDPHGEFVEEILSSIPSHRADDVVYFNPADTEWPVSFNILEVTNPKYKHLVASGLIGIFTKIWANVWSARMEYILANCILALLDTPGTTLLGIPRILVDKDYRQKIINNLKDPVVRSFWVNEYEEWSSFYRNEAIAPIQNKVGQFLNVSLIRNIVGQPKSTVDIAKIMNEGKILLINVSKGRVGEDNSAILGAMLITKIQLMAMERVRIPEEERRDFYLYVDEFQNFATDSFVNILSEARKYRLDLIIAHQYIGQLVTETTTAVRDAVFGNVGTLISFRVGAADAEFLEQEFSPEFSQEDLCGLPNYNIYLKLMIGGITCRPFSAVTIPPAPVGRNNENRAKIVAASRRKCSSKRAEVENKISEWAGASEFAGALAQAAKIGSAQQTKLYDAVCANCGKKTKVVFEPTPDRPAYCRSCMKKIRAKREKAPAPREDLIQGRKIQRASDLEKLGIEFEPLQNQKLGKKEKRSLESESLPLEQIVKKEPVFFGRKKNKKPVNLEELRKSLSDALEKAKAKQEKSEMEKDDYHMKSKEKKLEE